MNNTHPYLRAYMAASVVPTFFLMFILTGFIILRLVLHIPQPIERGIIFPMAFVPNLFGLWNLIYVSRREHWRLPIGAHGALLPLLLLPTGLALATHLEFARFAHGGLLFFGAVAIPYTLIAIGLMCAMIAYYLVWKYIIGYFNQVLGIA